MIKMYIELDKELFNKIENKVGYTYEKKELESGILIDKNAVLGMLEDLLNELDVKEEKIENLEKAIREDYRPLNPTELGWE